MSSSGLIYAAIVGAWAAYLVPMWLRRQDELNEARHTERFTTAIRILSRRGSMERRYARMIATGDDGLATSSVALPLRDDPPPPEPDLGRAEKAPPGSADHADTGEPRPRRRADVPAAQAPRARQVHASVDDTAHPGSSAGAFERSRGSGAQGSEGAGERDAEGRRDARRDDVDGRRDSRREDTDSRRDARRDDAEMRRDARRDSGDAPAHARVRDNAAVRPPAERPNAPRPGAEDAAAGRRFGFGRAARTAAPPKPPAPLKRPDGRAKLLARRRRVVVGLFLLFTGGAVVTGMLGIAWLWLPVLPGLALTGYIAYLRVQERRRYETDLRNELRATPPPRSAPPQRPARKGDTDAPRRAAAGSAPDPGDTGSRRRPADAAGGAPVPPRAPGVQRPHGERAAPAPEARARADRRDAEERDHAEWIATLQGDREPGRPGDAPSDAGDRDAWDPVPVPLPTYVTAPVVPRGEPALPERPEPEQPPAPPTPLFDQYAEDPRRGLPVYDQTQWPRAGNE